MGDILRFYFEQLWDRLGGGEDINRLHRRKEQPGYSNDSMASGGYLLQRVGTMIPRQLCIGA